MDGDMLLLLDEETLTSEMKITKKLHLQRMMRKIEQFRKEVEDAKSGQEPMSTAGANGDEDDEQKFRHKRQLSQAEGIATPPRAEEKVRAAPTPTPAPALVSATPAKPPVVDENTPAWRRPPSMQPQAAGVKRGQLTPSASVEEVAKPAPVVAAAPVKAPLRAISSGWTPSVHIPNANKHIMHKDPQLAALFADTTPTTPAPVIATSSSQPPRPAAPTRVAFAAVSHPPSLPARKPAAVPSIPKRDSMYKKKAQVVGERQRGRSIEEQEGQSDGNNNDDDDDEDDQDAEENSTEPTHHSSNNNNNVSKFCPSCGVKRHSTGSKFCPSCGYKFS